MIDNTKKMIFKKIKEISQLISVDDVIPPSNYMKKEEYFTTYNNLMINGINDNIRFNNLVDEIWSTHKLIEQNYTRNKIIYKILDLASLKENLKKDDVDNWLETISENEVNSYWIYREIKGVELSKNQIINLGSFCILDKIHHKDHIIKESTYIQSNWDKISKHCEGDLLIGVEVKVRNIETAYELANKKFKLFENIMMFIFEYNKRYEVSIVHQIDSSTEKSFAITDTLYGTNTSLSKKGIILIDLNSFVSDNPDILIRQIFSLFEKDERSDIENRIMIAIDWVGKGLREVDREKTFIQLMFGIEALLSYRDSDIIQPSIISRFSEYIAFTLGNDYSSRTKFEKDFKKLYAIRSAIVHGSNKSVFTGDFMLLKYIVKKLTLTFIDNIKQYNIKEITEYNEWIKKKKYDFK